MYFKEVEDDKRDKETEEFVKSEVDKLNGAEVEFWKILRKTKTDMVNHLEERKTTVSNKLKKFVEEDPIHGALQKRRKGLEARLKKLHGVLESCELYRAARPAFTPSLFPRLVLGWIDADFCVQIRIFQHFSTSTRFIHLRTASTLKICRFLQFFVKFRLIFQMFANVAEIAAKIVIFR